MNNVPPYNIVQSNEIIELLKNEDALTFLNDNFHKQPDMLSLKYSGKVAFNLTKLTQILQLYRKAQDKLPIWVENRCAMHSKSYEQSSHWKIAEFKSNLMHGKSLLDLTAGLGVDSYYFAQNFDSVSSIEKDKDTHQFAVYNAHQLNTPNITNIHLDLADFEFKQRYDVIYLDPDRRVTDERALGNIGAYSPNILEWHKKWLQHTDNLLIKLSPMVDISYLENTFELLDTTFVISYKNEVKEILIHLKNKPSSTKTRFAVDINSAKTVTYSGTPASKNVFQPHDSGKYLYEPSKALIKSGLAQSYCTNIGLAPTHTGGLYFVSDEDFSAFMGRQFEIINRLECNWKTIKKYLKSNGIKQIQITQRHFFDSVKSIREKIKIPEGGNTFLQFTKDNNDKPLCYHTRLRL